MKRFTNFRLKHFMMMTLSFVLLVTQFVIAEAGDTWPYKGSQSHGKNEPSVHGYTSEHILDWSPETDSDAEKLRSFVPLQKRNEAFAATQANPTLDANMQMINVAGDYGNAFIENAPYTNKFAQYHFNFWQYVDMYSYWHGTATAYTPPEYYDELAQKDWQQKWFEFGMLNIPNPTYTDAAHKNGVLSLAGVFFSNNDRGQQTYKHMIVKDENGNFPVAQKMIEMADYFGFDGYFMNQEEVGPNVETKDIETYKEFLHALKSGVLSNGNQVYVQWYDSLNTSSGQNIFARTINDSNVDMLFDRNTQKSISDSFFFDYGMSDAQITSAITYLNNLNIKYGTEYNLFDVGFGGIEAGRDRFKNTRNFSGKGVSLATLGADFVHAGLDEDMNLIWPDDKRHDNDFQWMTHVRERLWWSGPNQNPANTSNPKAAEDVFIKSNSWNGIANQIVERSVISGRTFYSNFNTGHGLNYYRNGEAIGMDEWSNMSLQDILPSWQWWQVTEGNELSFDFDYGEAYTKGDTRFAYQSVNPYEGGSSLVAHGDLNKDVYLHLFKTNLEITANTTLKLAIQKVNTSNAKLQVGMIFKDNPEVTEYKTIALDSLTENAWGNVELELEDYADRNLASIGLKFVADDVEIKDYQINIGNITIADGSENKTVKPSNVKIDKIHEDTKEATITWTKADYTKVQSYNVYVNDVFVGGKYDEVFYIKSLPASSGVIKVVPVGVDGLEGEGTTINFNLNQSGVSNIAYESLENGNVTISWDYSGTSKVVPLTLETYNISTSNKLKEVTNVNLSDKVLKLNNMPIDGQEFYITIGTETPLSISGNFIDKISEPYNEDFVDYGSKIDLPQPRVKDWRYMYVFADGQQMSFPTTYGVGNKDKIIRGRSTKASLTLNTSANEVYVVIEDYSGNKSEPFYLRKSVDLSIKTEVSELGLGDKQQFEVTIDGLASTDGVNWYVTGHKSLNTKIDSSGLLEIGLDETSRTIKVVAKLKTNENITVEKVVTLDVPISKEPEELDLLIHSYSSIGIQPNETIININDGDNDTKWTVNSKTGWVIVDLEDIYTVSKWYTLHGEWGDKEPGFNTKAFALEVYSEVDLDEIGEWIEVDFVDNSSAQKMEYDLDITPTTGRFFRLRIDDATINQYTAVRIHEFKLFGILFIDEDVDTTELTELLNILDGLVADDYTQASWEALLTEITKVENMLFDQELTQEIVDSAYTSLFTTYQQLIKKQPVNKEQLLDKINEINNLNEGDYTEETWSTLKQYLNEANKINNNKDATQEEIDSIEALLSEALDALELSKYPEEPKPEEPKPEEPKPEEPKPEELKPEEPKPEEPKPEEPKPEEPINPEIEKETWDAESSLNGLVFILDMDIKDFRDVFINGIKLTKGKDYTVREGSVIVTLLDSYLNTLENGEHNIRFDFADNVELETSFTVINNSVTNDSMKEEHLPSTGSISLIPFVGISMLLSLIFFVLNKKRFS